VLDGFLVGNKARGRPVGVVIDKPGDLLVADDVGNVVWRVTPAGGQAPTRMAAAVPQRLAGW
jgi:glucose/arabinose dehydrogenase